MYGVTEVIRHKIIIFLRKLKRLFLERLPIDIYNLRIEYHNAIIDIVEEEQDNDIIIIFGIEQCSVFSYY